MINLLLDNKEWIFSGIGIVCITWFVILIKKIFINNKKDIEPSQKDTSKLKIHVGDNNKINGNIAGRDIIINSPIDPKINELICILERRAKIIGQKLQSTYSSINTENYLIQFNNLHEKHISALKEGKLILAHEILKEIHQLSYDIECENVCARITYKPGTDYAQAADAFTKGPLVCFYMVGDYTLKSPRYPYEIETLTFSMIDEDQIGKTYLEAFNIKEDWKDQMMPICRLCGTILNRTEIDNYNITKIMKHLDLATNGKGLLIGDCCVCKKEYVVLTSELNNKFTIVSEVE